MREIKFRGRESDGHWAYGDLKLNEARTRAIITLRKDGYLFPCLVDIETVGQFIGLCDSNGKEIYERDIVDFTENICDGDEVIVQGRGYVKYDGNTAAFVIMSDRGYIPFIEIGEMRVIGNVYDSPEFLERML